MDKLNKLEQLLKNPTPEQTLEVIFEKDQPFGKEVMDLVRELSAEKHRIPSTVGNFGFQAIWSFGTLKQIVSLKDKVAHEKLKQMHREKWAMRFKPIMEDLFKYPDGFHTGCAVYDYMDGNYPALKEFEATAKAYFKIKDQQGRPPTNEELIKLNVRHSLQRVKLALNAVRHYDT